jgi:hypothetical protein
MLSKRNNIFAIVTSNVNKIFMNLIIGVFVSKLSRQKRHIAKECVALWHAF